MTPLLAYAAQLLKAGQSLGAIPLLQQAAALDPSNPKIQHDLGLAYLETGRFAEAAAALGHATEASPNYADAHFRLGIALEKLGVTEAAIRAYDRATDLHPRHTEAWFRAGALVYTLGHRAEAAGCFRRAAATGPKTGFGRLGAARALLAEDRDAEAERELRQLLSLDRDNAMALDLLGNVLADSGRFDGARDCFTRAVAQAPLMAGTWYDLVRCRRLTGADADLLPRMHAALETPGLDELQRLRVHLAVGKAADDLGDPETAMRHFDAASDIRTRLTPFETGIFAAQIERLIARFTPQFCASLAAAGSPDATPILIVGMPRSGTTLLEQILSSHPDVTGAGELNFWNERGVAWLQSAPDAPPAPFLAQAAADYLALLRGIGPNAVRVTDKMPFNFLWVGLIHAAFPRAAILHCRRAMIDTALSIHQTNFNPNVAFPTGGPDLVAYFHAYRRLTDHWRAVLPANRFIDVDYNDLTATPGPVIRRIIDACGLPWHESCLHPEHNQRVVKTPSKWQARQPIYRTAIDRWRRYELWLGVLRELL